MKLLTLVSSLLAVAYAAESEILAEKPTTAGAQGEKILPRLASSAPKDGAKRTVVKYGSYSVTSAKMMQKTIAAKGPCGITPCLVTAMEATIRYPDGKEANVDTGAWLHHIALFGSGGGQGSIWAAGNERPTLRLNSESKYGLQMTSFMLMIDLMTEDTKPKNLTLEINYEHLPLGSAGYKPATMYWLTIGEPAAKNGVYKFTTMSSTSSSAAKLLYAIGHMHDGGTDMRLYVGSKMVCKSVMHYNAREGYGADGAAAPAKGAAAPAKGAAKGGDMAGMSHGHSKVRRDGPHAGGHGGGGEHISDPGACTDFGEIAKGEKMYAEAWYDANKHPLMVHNGKKEALMGNMRVYVGPK